MLNETRVNLFDYVTIGKFRAKRDLRVVNPSGLLNISPFDYVDSLERFALNRDIFRELSIEIAKPLRRSDGTLEYLPTNLFRNLLKVGATTVLNLKVRLDMEDIIWRCLMRKSLNVLKSILWRSKKLIMH